MQLTTEMLKRAWNSEKRHSYSIDNTMHSWDSLSNTMQEDLNVFAVNLLEQINVNNTNFTQNLKYNFTIK